MMMLLRAAGALAAALADALHVCRYLTEGLLCSSQIAALQVLAQGLHIRVQSRLPGLIGISKGRRRRRYRCLSILR
jgi:hypothetical protein